jgi:hypothetical protein
MLARKVPPRLGHGSPRIQLVAPADPARDAAINSEWDLLIRLAAGAWVWHSPESLDVLEQTVVRLRAWIARELVDVTPRRSSRVRGQSCRGGTRQGAVGEQLLVSLAAGVVIGRVLGVHAMRRTGVPQSGTRLPLHPCTAMSSQKGGAGRWDAARLRALPRGPQGTLTSSSRPS